MQAEQVARFEDERADLVVAARKTFEGIFQGRLAASGDGRDEGTLAAKFEARMLEAQRVAGQAVLGDDPGHGKGAVVGERNLDDDAVADLQGEAVGRIVGVLAASATNGASGAKGIDASAASQRVSRSRPSRTYMA